MGRAMRAIIIQVLALIAVAVTVRAQPRPAEAGRPEVLVLGTYHMSNPGRDVINLTADDVLSPKRQQEVAELAIVLEKFKPTKLAVEAEYGSEVVPKRYAEYLVGTHVLSRNEVEQIGFRVAKDLGHSTIYPVDVDGDFPLQRVTNYAKATGMSDTLHAIMNGGWGAMVKSLDEFLKTHTVLQALLYVSSDTRVAQDVGLYHQLARFGEPGDYAGPDLLAEWYRRNVRIYNNVAKLATSPGERILVIYGYGHLGWLRQIIAADPTLRLRRLEEFAPTANVGAGRR